MPQYKREIVCGRPGRGFQAPTGLYLPNPPRQKKRPPAARLPGADHFRSKAQRALAEDRSSETPGPMVEDSETFLR